MNDERDESILTVRAALILTVALLIGGGVAALSALAGASLPAVLLAGVTAFGAAVPALGKLIR
jgi:hypothetical protein